MARTRRSRRYRRRSASWSSNIQKINLTGTTTAGQVFGDSFTLAQNPEQANSSVSQYFTVKNIEVSGQLEAQYTSVAYYPNIEDIVYYIMYVPEGYQIDLNLPIKHPEWIMAYKYIGQAASTNSSNYDQPPKIKTRLSRKLNPGDSIIFMYTGLNNTTDQNLNVKFLGLVRWWTKAN